MKFTCTKEGDMCDIAKEISEIAEQSNSDKAFVVGLFGDLGSGKTTFTKHFADTFDIDGEVTSPTFILQKNFNIENNQLGKFKKLFHLDLYRLESEEELKTVGWQEMVSDPTNLVFVEWPQLVENDLSLQLNFTFIDEETREVEIQHGKD